VKKDTVFLGGKLYSEIV